MVYRGLLTAFIVLTVACAWAQRSDPFDLNSSSAEGVANKAKVFPGFSGLSIMNHVVTIESDDESVWKDQLYKNQKEEIEAFEEALHRSGQGLRIDSFKLQPKKLLWMNMPAPPYEFEWNSQEQTIILNLMIPHVYKNLQSQQRHNNSYFRSQPARVLAASGDYSLLGLCNKHQLIGYWAASEISAEPTILFNLTPLAYSADGIVSRWSGWLAYRDGSRWQSFNFERLSRTDSLQDGFYYEGSGKNGEQTIYLVVEKSGAALGAVSEQVKLHICYDNDDNCAENPQMLLEAYIPVVGSARDGKK